jgi:uncharacterized repeat protein (TIGR04138 family)
MPPQHEHKPDIPPRKTIDQVIDELGIYPREAFEFVRRGLSFTVEKIHREITDPQASRHISGQQLCGGLRDLALAQWGLMAPAVLKRWNIRRTEDFGKIVFTLVNCGELAKTDEDTIEDFRHVFDFSTAFDEAFIIDRRAIRKGIESGL